MRQSIIGFIAGGLVVLFAMLFLRSRPQESPPASPPTGTSPTSGTLFGGSSSGGRGRPANMPDVQGPTDGNDIALKAVGMNSAEELARELARLSDSSLQAQFEAAYRKTYAVRQAQRAYAEAGRLAGEVIGRRPDFAPAYRVQGYARFNSGNPDGALVSYRKAVELDPNYGEAQYALAFLYVMTDVAAGKTHFQKAMALGIKDELDIGPRYFGLWQ